MQRRKVLTIVGPTASGKTDAAYNIAKRIRTQTGKEPVIISADSRQAYKHIPIATAQPPKEYLAEIKHYFVNELELDEEFNSGEFGNEGREIIQKSFDEDKVPIIVGGSGLYINSLIYGFFDFDDVEDEQFEKTRKEIRKSLYERKDNEGIESLYKELGRVDKESAARMQLINERRIIRALEVYELTGTPLSQWQNKKIDIGFEPAVYGLKTDRQELYGRINKRVDEMIVNGLIEEAEGLKKKGYDYVKYNSLNTVGIKEAFDYLDGKISYERMTALIKQNTRRFAKRQMTWFRRDKNIKWVENWEEIDISNILN